MWSGDMFGSSEEDDLDVLLALFCKHLSEGKTGREICNSLQNLFELWQTLKFSVYTQIKWCTPIVSTIPHHMSRLHLMSLL